MKAAYILTKYPSLTETFAETEIQCMEESGFEITVFAADGKEYIRKPDKNTKSYYRPSLFSVKAVNSIIFLLLRYPFGLYRFAWLLLRFNWSSPAEAVSLIRNFHTVCYFIKILDELKIYHIHAYFLSWPACIGSAIAVITNRGFSIACHGRDIHVEHGAAEVKASIAKFITVCSKHGSERLKTLLPVRYHDKLYVNHHGIRNNLKHCSYSGRLFSSIGKNMVIAVGRLVPKKGFAVLIEAFRIISHKKPDLFLTIVGEGPMRNKLEKLSIEAGLGEKVIFPGRQEHNVTLRLIREAAILIAPSVTANDGDIDGIPNVILEAFSLGVPVIAGNAGGIAEAVLHNKTGLLFEPGNAGELASLAIRLIEDKKLQIQLSENAHRMISKSFNAAKNVNQLINLFREDI